MIDAQEIRYRYHERLGIMCGLKEPDSLHKKVARAQVVKDLVDQGMEQRKAISTVFKAIAVEDVPN